MSAGNRKHPYRVNTEYADNLRRHQKHNENHVLLAMLFVVLIAVLLGLFLGFTQT